MRFSLDTFTVALLALALQSSIAHPQPHSDIEVAVRDVAAALEQRDNGAVADITNLRKRIPIPKGGGGGGGGRGGGGGGGGSSGSSGGSRGGSGGSGSTGGRGSGVSSTPRGAAAPNSNVGGKTIQGTGPRPAYGGGRYYGGGATVPYKSGGRSPAGLIGVPLLAGALLIYPGIWLYGAYAYPYHHPYSYYNRTARHNHTQEPTTTSAVPTATPTGQTRRSLIERFFEIEARQNEDTGANETKPVTCLCAMYSVCGCDDNSDTSFLDSVIGDGDYAKLNQSLVQVADINGTSTIVLNGTLPNGTTASGGTEDAFEQSASSSDSGSGGSSAGVHVVQASGYWVMIALVGLTCFFV